LWHCACAEILRLQVRHSGIRLYCLHMSAVNYKPLEASNIAAREEGPPSLYLNIFVAEKTPELDALVQEKVAEKVSAKVPSGPLGGGAKLGARLGQLAGKMAIKKVGTEVIASKMGDKMAIVMPQKMAAMGITAKCEEVYRKGPFIVVHVAIMDADIHKLVAQQAGEDKADKADSVLAFLKTIARWLGREDAFHEKVQNSANAKVVEGLCKTLPEVLPEKLADKGLIVEVVAKPVEEEAAFLFEVLKRIEE